MAKFIFKKTNQVIETNDKDKIKSLEKNPKYKILKDKTEEFIDKNYCKQFTDLKDMIKNTQKDIDDLKKEVAQLKKK